MESFILYRLSLCDITCHAQNQYGICLGLELPTSTFGYPALHCMLYNLRKAHVTLSNLRKAHVTMSNLRKAHVACHYLFIPHVACH